MNIAPLADVQAHLGAYIKQLQTTPVVVTENGKPVAVMMGVSDNDDLERIMLAVSPTFQSLLDKAEKRIHETGGTSHDEIWAQIEAEDQT